MFYNFYYESDNSTICFIICCKTNMEDHYNLSTITRREIARCYPVFQAAAATYLVDRGL